MKCAPPPPSWLPATGKKAEHRPPWDKAEKAREWDHCQNYTIKRSSQQNHKTDPLSGVWPGWLATTYPSFLCDRVLCHFPSSDTERRKQHSLKILLCGVTFQEHSWLFVIIVAILRRMEITKGHVQEATPIVNLSEHIYIKKLNPTCSIMMGTATTGNTSRFANTAVFPLSIKTAAIRSETEAERKGQRDMQTDRESKKEGEVRQRAIGMLEFNSRAC